MVVMEIFCRSLIRMPSKNSFRFRINWFVIFSVNFLNGLSQLIQAPSLHQFVTSSATQNKSTIEPGLGLSETWYSVIISMGAAGTFIGAVSFGLLARHVYIKPGLVVELIFEFTGGILYAFGNNGWLILLSRLFIGIFSGIHMALMRLYVLETSDQLIQALPQEKQARSTIKYTAMFVMFSHGLTGQIIGPILSAIAAQIPSISNFRWPGYYISIHSFLLLVVVFLLFNEKWTDVIRGGRGGGDKKLSFREKVLVKLRTPAIPHYLLIVFVYLFFIFGWNITILETLQNPILSDQFGLNIKNTSYVFIGVIAIYLISVFCMYFFQKLHVDNRLILIGGFITAIIGTLIMTDWQSIGGDPCNYELSECTNEPNEQFCCEQFNNASEYECFWNPVSRITGEYCERCRPVCLSKEHTLNFVQMLAGMVLLSFCLAPGRLLVTTIASDISGGNSQGFLMGTLVASGAISRATGPLWGNPTYLIVGHRTWLTMLILTGVQVIALVLLIVLYRKMTKKLPTVIVNHTEEDMVELLTEDESREEEESKV